MPRKGILRGRNRNKNKISMWGFYFQGNAKSAERCLKCLKDAASTTKGRVLRRPSQALVLKKVSRNRVEVTWPRPVCGDACALFLSMALGEQWMTDATYLAGKPQHHDMVATAKEEVATAEASTAEKEVVAASAAQPEPVETSASAAKPVESNESQPAAAAETSADYGASSPSSGSEVSANDPSSGSEDLSADDEVFAASSSSGSCSTRTGPPPLRTYREDWRDLPSHLSGIFHAHRIREFSYTGQLLRARQACSYRAAAVAVSRWR